MSSSTTETNRKQQPEHASLAPAAVNAPSSASRRIATVLLLLLGGLLWFAVGSSPGIGVVRSIVIGAAVAAALVPGATRGITRALDRIRCPSSRAVEWASLLIGMGAAAYFVLTAFLQHRDLFPKTHDDCSYMLQMQMLARGRLWMPAHPLADFFDSFYLLVRPVYASQYFPGTALMYVPTVWLGWPSWLMPVMAAGAVVGLVYRIVTELVDGAAGALAALWMISLSWFRMLSILLMSQVPALLLGLLMIWGWLRWRRSRHRAWLIFIGAIAGWAAITRPIDALCFALPVGAALAAELFRSRRREWLLSAALLSASAGPFLAVQLVFDKRVTGRWLETPFRFYLDRDMPGTQFGFPLYDPGARPRSDLPQKRQLYRDWVVPFIRAHQPHELLRSWVHRWLPMIVHTTLPAGWLLPIAAAGLLGLTDRKRWVLGATVPLFVLLYVCYTIFLEHYAVVIAPAMALLLVMGIGALSDAWPRFRRQITAAASCLVVVTALTSLPELSRLLESDPKKQASDETFVSNMLSIVNEQLPQQLQKPAIVLFRFAPGVNPAEEPVYNVDTANPDDAPLIRAHDLGARNVEIFRYYALRQPERWFYLYDESTNAVTPLGPAASLAHVKPGN